MAKESKKINRIVKARIEFLSLCPKGANTLKTVYKTDSGNKNVTLTALTKELSDQGELIACVYSPGLVDTQGDYAPATVIKKMAYDFAYAGLGIDIRHDEKVIPKDEAFVAESFIIQKNDPRFVDMKTYEGAPVDVTGGWGVVIKIEDERLRELYRSGAWGGISMGGFMLTEDEEITTEKNLFQKMTEFFDNYKTKNKNHSKSEINMDKSELKAVLAENNAELAKTIKEALAPAPNTPAKKEAEGTKKLGLGWAKPVLKEGATAEELGIYAKKLEIFQLSEAVDKEDLTAIHTFNQLAKEIATGKKGDVAVTKEDKDCYNSFFTTNQSTHSNTENLSEDKKFEKELVDDLEKEDKAKK